MTVKFKKKAVLTRPILKLQEDVSVYVTITKAMYVGKEMKQRQGEERKKEPATILECINLETGEECQVLASAVIKSVLDESYPNATYVNKSFSFTKQARQPGKQYNPVHVEEIEIEEEKKDEVHSPRAVGGKK